MQMCKKAFTLVEILILVVILGILAAIVIPQFKNPPTNEELAVQALYAEARDHVIAFERENGRHSAHGFEFMEVVAPGGDLYLVVSFHDDMVEETGMQQRCFDPDTKKVTMTRQEMDQFKLDRFNYQDGPEEIGKVPSLNPIQESTDSGG